MSHFKPHILSDDWYNQWMSHGIHDSEAIYTWCKCLINVFNMVVQAYVYHIQFK